jgi:glutamate racemase
VDWIDPAEAIARRALSLLPPNGVAESSRGDDIAVFTSGRPNPATQRLMHGFGLAVED